MRRLACVLCRWARWGGGGDTGYRACVRARTGGASWGPSWLPPVRGFAPPTGGALRGVGCRAAFGRNWPTAGRTRPRSLPRRPLPSHHHRRHYHDRRHTCSRRLWILCSTTPPCVSRPASASHVVAVVPPPPSATMATAFAVTGMFPTAKTAGSAFTANALKAPVAAPAKAATSITMVDAFQRRFQSPGKIGIDYSRPRKLSSYKRSGPSSLIDYPISPAMAGFYTLSTCGRSSGASKTLAKADEYMAKGINMVYKRTAVASGVYTTKCAESTTPGGAEFKRVFNRISAFKAAQKSPAAKASQKFQNRRKAIIASHGCHHEEVQFCNNPMSASVYLAGRNEANGTCIRYATPSSAAEEYMARSIMDQKRRPSAAGGVFRVSQYCTDGHSKYQAEQRRVAALAGEFRAVQQGPSATTAAAYKAPTEALTTYGHGDCNAEEVIYRNYPATAMAMVTD